MSGESVEVLRVREEIAITSFIWDYRFHWKQEVSEFHWKNDYGWAKDKYYRLADQILKIKGLLVEAEDQSLPDVYRELHEIQGETAGALVDVGSYQRQAQTDMLSAGFRKVV